MAPKAAAWVHLVLLPVLLFLLPAFSLALTSQDFCVANRQLPATPSGYPCKPQALVDSDDFYSDALARPGPIVAPFNAALASATVEQFAGLNGLGVAAQRVDILPGGVAPMHPHPKASELLFVIAGTVSAGFVSGETNIAYVKTLRTGDLFVYPQGVMHFEYNVGNSTAIVFSAYSSDNPGLQITDYALFGNTLPADVVTKLTFISRAEVQRLKAFFGIVSGPA